MLLTPQGARAAAERAEADLGRDGDVPGAFVHLPITVADKLRAATHVRRVPLSPIPERSGRRIFHGDRKPPAARGREPAVLEATPRGAPRPSRRDEEAASPFFWPAQRPGDGGAVLRAVDQDAAVVRGGHAAAGRPHHG